MIVGLFFGHLTVASYFLIVLLLAVFLALFALAFVWFVYKARTTKHNSGGQEQGAKHRGDFSFHGAALEFAPELAAFRRRRADSITKKRCLVTGGAGIVGRALVKVLIEENEYDSITVMDLRTPNDPPYDHPSVKVICGDVRLSEDDENACRGMDTVFHCAAIMGHRRRRQYLGCNAAGTAKIVHACVRCGVQNLIFASCASIVRNGTNQYDIEESTPTAPQTPFSESKWLAETLVLAANGHAGLRTVVLRAPTILDVRDHHVVAYSLVRGLPFSTASKRKNPLHSFCVSESFAKALAAADRKLDGEFHTPRGRSPSPFNRSLQGANESIDHSPKRSSPRTGFDELRRVQSAVVPRIHTIASSIQYASVSGKMYYVVDFVAPLYEVIGELYALHVLAKNHEELSDGNPPTQFMETPPSNTSAQSEEICSQQNHNHNHHRDEEVLDTLQFRPKRDEKSSADKRELNRAQTMGPFTSLPVRPLPRKRKSSGSSRMANSNPREPKNEHKPAVADDRSPDSSVMKDDDEDRSSDSETQTRPQTPALLVSLNTRKLLKARKNLSHAGQSVSELTGKWIAAYTIQFVDSILFWFKRDLPLFDLTPEYLRAVNCDFVIESEKATKELGIDTLSMPTASRKLARQFWAERSCLLDEWWRSDRKHM